MTERGIDWERTWRAHLARLLPILAGIAALLPEGVDTVSRLTRWTILAALRPAESAARRIIVVAARALAAKGVTVETPPKRVRGKREGRRRRRRRVDLPAFPMFDRRKRVGPPPEKKTAGYGPNVRGLDGSDPPPPPAPPPLLPDDPTDTASLRRRLASVTAAMADVEGQALRMARTLASGRSRYASPLRVGRPPGHRERRLTVAGHPYRGWRAVDELLHDTQHFARLALMPP